jgi:hypothetical protein
MPFPSKEQTVWIKLRMTAYHRCRECGGGISGLISEAPLLVAFRSLAFTPRIPRDTRQAAKISLPAAMVGGRVGGGIMIDLFLIFPNIPCDQRCGRITTGILRVLLRNIYQCSAAIV